MSHAVAPTLCTSPCGLVFASAVSHLVHLVGERTNLLTLLLMGNVSWMLIVLQEPASDEHPGTPGSKISHKSVKKIILFPRIGTDVGLESHSGEKTWIFPFIFPLSVIKVC